MDAELRLKLDRRIHNQRRALRDNWEIVEMRTRGHRRFTASAIKLGTEACDLAGIPRHSSDGLGWLGYHERMRRLKALLAQGMETAKPPKREAGSARKGDSPVA
jgi:hypothetical protein